MVDVLQRQVQAGDGGHEVPGVAPGRLRGRLQEQPAGDQLAVQQLLRPDGDDPGHVVGGLGGDQAFTDAAQALLPDGEALTVPDQPGHADHHQGCQRQGTGRGEEDAVVGLLDGEPQQEQWRSDQGGRQHRDALGGQPSQGGQVGGPAGQELDRRVQDAAATEHVDQRRQGQELGGVLPLAGQVGPVGVHQDGGDEGRGQEAVAGGPVPAGHQGHGGRHEHQEPTDAVQDLDDVGRRGERGILEERVEHQGPLDDGRGGAGHPRVQGQVGVEAAQPLVDHHQDGHQDQRIGHEGEQVAGRREREGLAHRLAVEEPDDHADQGGHGPAPGRDGREPHRAPQAPGPHADEDQARERPQDVDRPLGVGRGHHHCQRPGHRGGQVRAEAPDVARGSVVPPDRLFSHDPSWIGRPGRK